MKEKKNLENFPQTLKKGIWILGTTSWMFGISDRSIASLADSYISAIDLIQLFTASFFLLVGYF